MYNIELGNYIAANNNMKMVMFVKLFLINIRVTNIFFLKKVCKKLP